MGACIVQQLLRVFPLVISDRNGTAATIRRRNCCIVFLRLGPLRTFCVRPSFLPLPRTSSVLYNVQLLRIEEELGDKAVYSGKNFRKPSWMA